MSSPSASTLLLVPRDVPVIGGVPTRRCLQGHPNDPTAEVCRVCRSIIEPDQPVVDVEPTPLVSLLFDDGQSQPLTGTLAVGRAPEEDDEGSTVPLPISGTQVSRRHAIVEVRGWRVMIRDAGSTNGTFVTREAERGRRPVRPQEPIELFAGDTVHFGNRQARVIASAETATNPSLPETSSPASFIAADTPVGRRGALVPLPPPGSPAAGLEERLGLG